MWDFASKLAEQAKELKAIVEDSFDEAIKFDPEQAGSTDSTHPGDGSDVSSMIVDDGASGTAMHKEEEQEASPQHPAEFGEADLQAMMAEARANLAASPTDPATSTAMSPRKSQPAAASARRSDSGDDGFFNDWGDEASPVAAGTVSAAESAPTSAAPPMVHSAPGDGWGDLDALADELGELQAAEQDQATTSGSLVLQTEDIQGGGAAESAAAPAMANGWGDLADDLDGLVGSGEVPAQGSSAVEAPSSVADEESSGNREQSAASEPCESSQATATQPEQTSSFPDTSGVEIAAESDAVDGWGADIDDLLIDVGSPTVPQETATESTPDGSGAAVETRGDVSVNNAFGQTDGWGDADFGDLEAQACLVADAAAVGGAAGTQAGDAWAVDFDKPLIDTQPDAAGASVAEGVDRPPSSDHGIADDDDAVPGLQNSAHAHPDLPADRTELPATVADSSAFASGADSSGWGADWDDAVTPSADAQEQAVAPECVPNGPTEHVATAAAPDDSAVASTDDFFANFSEPQVSMPPAQAEPIASSEPGEVAAECSSADAGGWDVDLLDPVFAHGDAGGPDGATSSSALPNGPTVLSHPFADPDDSAQGSQEDVIGNHQGATGGAIEPHAAATTAEREFGGCLVQENFVSESNVAGEGPSEAAAQPTFAVDNDNIEESTEKCPEPDEFQKDATSKADHTYAASGEHGDALANGNGQTVVADAAEPPADVLAPLEEVEAQPVAADASGPESAVNSEPAAAPADLDVATTPELPSPAAQDAAGDAQEVPNCAAGPTSADDAQPPSTASHCETAEASEPVCSATPCADAEASVVSNAADSAATEDVGNAAAAPDSAVPDVSEVEGEGEKAAQRTMTEPAPLTNAAEDGDDTAMVRAKIKTLWARHNAQAGGDLDPILTKYEGNEHKLYFALCKKYGVEPDILNQGSPASDSTSSPSMTSPQASAETGNAPAEEKGDQKEAQQAQTGENEAKPEAETSYRAKIIQIYKEHNPEKLQEVDTIFAKYAGKEDKLYAAVCKKYGVIPDESVGAPTSTQAASSAQESSNDPSAAAGGAGFASWLTPAAVPQGLGASLFQAASAAAAAATASTGTNSGGVDSAAGLLQSGLGVFQGLKENVTQQPEQPQQANQRQQHGQQQHPEEQPKTQQQEHPQHQQEHQQHQPQHQEQQEEQQEQQQHLQQQPAQNEQQQPLQEPKDQDEPEDGQQPPNEAEDRQQLPNEAEEQATEQAVAAQSPPVSKSPPPYEDAAPRTEKPEHEDEQAADQEQQEVEAPAEASVEQASERVMNGDPAEQDVCGAEPCGAEMDGAQQAAADGNSVEPEAAEEQPVEQSNSGVEDDSKSGEEAPAADEQAGVGEERKAEESAATAEERKAEAPETKAEERKTEMPEKTADAEAEDESILYQRRIEAFYREHNPEKLSEVDGMLAKYKGKERQLYSAICRKYGKQADAPTHEAATPSGDETGSGGSESPSGAATGSLVESAVPATAVGAEMIGGATSEGQGAEASGSAFSSWFQRSAVASTISDGGFLQGLQRVQTAAEGLKKNVERQFEDAVRSQEDSSALDAVQSLKGAVENAAKEATAAKAAGGAAFSQAAVTAAPVVVAGPSPSSSSSAAAPGADSGVAPGVGQVQVSAELLQELDALRTEREALKAERDTLRSERKGLLDEGTRMSNRMHAIEQRMKEVVAEARRSQEKVSELERAKSTLEAKAAKLSGRAATAEAQVDEQRSELRRVNQELHKVRSQLQSDQRSLVQEQEARERRQKEEFSRARQMEDRLQEQLDAASRERAELVATNQALNSSLQQARAAADAAERSLDAAQAEAARMAEEQQSRLEEVELEFARQSLPYTRQIAALEAKVSLHEQQLGERDGSARRAVEEAEAKAAASAQKLEAVEATRKQEAEARQAEAQRYEQASAEVAELKRQASEAWSAREAAEQRREGAEADFRFEASQRQAAEQRAAELAERVEELTQKMAQQQRQPPPPQISQASPRVASGAAVPALMPSPSSGGNVNDQQASSRQLDAESRRLRMEVDSLKRQRDELTKESAQLQTSVDAMRREAGGNVSASRGVLLEQKFEAALQMIGQLQEELETSREECDMLKAAIAAAGRARR